jgi:hypothetical protein
MSALIDFEWLVDPVSRGRALPARDSRPRPTSSRVPVMLLPGTLAACLWSYELLAGCAISRLVGAIQLWRTSRAG